MPDLDPQPPQPRPISAARWLLMLTPSVIVIFTLFFDSVLQSFHLSIVGTNRIEGFSLLFALGLCFFLGFRLETWRHAGKRNILRSFCFSYVVAICNLSIIIALAFAGCLIGAS